MKNRTKDTLSDSIKTPGAENYGLWLESAVNRVASYQILVDLSPHSAS